MKNKLKANLSGTLNYSVSCHLITLSLVWHKATNMMQPIKIKLTVVCLFISFSITFRTATIVKSRRETIDKPIRWKKLATLVEGDPKAPFSTPRRRAARYSISWIPPLYP